MRPEPAVADDAQLRARVGALVAQALEGLSAFDAAYPAAERAANAGGTQGSDSWVAAQQALSRLEAARSKTSTARAELDRIAIERATLPTSAGDREVLSRALTEVDRIGSNEQVRLQRLLGELPNR